MRRFNLTGALAAGQRQDLATLRTHPTRRPREDIFLPEQNSLISLSVQPKVQTALATAGPLLQRNSVPSTHMRWRTTARRLATATIARRMPRRWATRMGDLALLGAYLSTLWATPELVLHPKADVPRPMSALRRIPLKNSPRLQRCAVSRCS